jgi:hypothetical protein
MDDVPLDPTFSPDAVTFPLITFPNPLAHGTAFFLAFAIFSKTDWKSCSPFFAFLFAPPFF